MRPPRVPVLTAAVLLLAAAPAAAEPQGTPAERRAYVSGGQYLADVAAATAPAKARLIERTDQIARDAGLCRRAGLPVSTGAPADATPLAPSRTSTGGVVLRLTSGSGAGRALRRAGVVVSAVGPATRNGARLRLPLRAFRVTSTSATVRPGGGLRLRRGSRTARVTSLRYVVKGTRISVTGQITGTRVTVLRGRTTKQRRVLDAAAVRARIASASVTLTNVATGRLERALRTRALRSGAFGKASATGAAGDPAITAAQCRALPAKPALVLDLDETALSNYLGTTGDPGGGLAGQFGPAIAGTSTALGPVLDLYREAVQRKVAVFFVTARPEVIRPQTEANLRRVGYPAWNALRMKPTGAEESAAFKTAQRRAAEADGFRVIVNAGDAQTDLDGGVAEATFKLPNRFY